MSSFAGAVAGGPGGLNSQKSHAGVGQNMQRQVSGARKGIPMSGPHEEEKVGKVVKVGASPAPVFKSQQPSITPKAGGAPQVIGLINKKQPQVANFAEGEEHVIKQKYKLVNFGKGGAFGDVFFAKHIEKAYDVAIKFSDSKNEEATRQYENEVEVMKIIKRVAGAKANLYPKLLANGKLEDKELNFIVMPKYDVDLERLFQIQRRRFKLETVITVGIQMVERLETMHNCGLVHNDLKPQNMMAHFKQNQVILIDFGLTLNQNATGKNSQVQYSFKGTPYFASNNQLVRGKLGPRDDIESLLYVLIYLIQGQLPWAKNVPVLGEELQAHLEVQQVIAQRDPDTLCSGMEPEFNTMLTYILSSSSKKRPDYRYIKKNLMAIKERYHFQGILEWYKPEPIPQQVPGSTSPKQQVSVTMFEVPRVDSSQMLQMAQASVDHVIGQNKGMLAAPEIAQGIQEHAKFTGFDDEHGETSSPDKIMVKAAKEGGKRTTKILVRKHGPGGDKSNKTMGAQGAGTQISPIDGIERSIDHMAHVNVTQTVGATKDAKKKGKIKKGIKKNMKKTAATTAANDTCAIPNKDDILQDGGNDGGDQDQDQDSQQSQSRQIAGQDLHNEDEQLGEVSVQNIKPDVEEQKEFPPPSSNQYDGQLKDSNSQPQNIQETDFQRGLNQSQKYQSAMSAAKKSGGGNQSVYFDGVHTQGTCAFNEEDFDEMIGDPDEGPVQQLIAPGRNFNCHENNLRYITEKTFSLKTSQAQRSFHPIQRQVESLEEQVQKVKSMKRLNSAADVQHEDDDNSGKGDDALVIQDAEESEEESEEEDSGGKKRGNGGSSSRSDESKS